ncbi:hypothetical protein ACHAXM_012097 [Skeletonema potamos]
MQKNESNQRALQLTMDVDWMRRLLTLKARRRSYHTLNMAQEVAQARMALITRAMDTTFCDALCRRCNCVPGTQSDVYLSTES